jgi:ABC-type transporter Mla MlaB component
VTTATAGGACVGEAHVITAAGAANRELWRELELALRAVYEDGGEKVAVDLSGLDAIDADSLDVVLRYLARFRARGGEVVLACPAALGLAGAVPTERRVDDAVAALLSSGGRS